MPRSYLPETRPGMIVSKVALTTLTFRPSSCPMALAMSASMPTTVVPFGPMNSLGAYVASAATIRVPFDLIALGTWDAGEPDGVGVGLVAAVVLAPQPAASSAVIEIVAV